MFNLPSSFLHLVALFLLNSSTLCPILKESTMTLVLSYPCSTITNQKWIYYCAKNRAILSYLLLNQLESGIFLNDFVSRRFLEIDLHDHGYLELGSELERQSGRYSLAANSLSTTVLSCYINTWYGCKSPHTSTFALLFF